MRIRTYLTAVIVCTGAWAGTIIEVAHTTKASVTVEYRSHQASCCTEISPAKKAPVTLGFLDAISDIRYRVGNGPFFRAEIPSYDTHNCRMQLCIHHDASREWKTYPNPSE